MLTPILIWQAPQLTGRVVTGMLVLGVLGAGLAYVLSFRLIGDIGAPGASAVNDAVPISAVLVGALFLGESITWNLVIGGLVLIAGVGHAEDRLRHPHRHRRRAGTHRRPAAAFLRSCLMTRLEPPTAGDERVTLDAFLDHQRATLLMKAEGLDRRQLNQPLPTSQLTLAGLLKHLALVEDDWIQVRFLGLPELEPWASAPWEQDRDWEFHSAEDDDPEALRSLYQEACARSRSAVAATDLGALSVGRNRDGQPWNLRWVLTHLIEETARHNGHADLLREAVDGSTGQ